MFLSSIRAEDRSPWGDFWFQPVSSRTASGARVNADSALRLAAVYACVRVLAETMAVLPVRVYRLRDDGGKEQLRDHWLYRLIARAPNRWQTPFEWREMLMGHMALRGNAYCRIVDRPDGSIGELVPMHPDAVRVEVLDSGEYRYRVKRRDGGEEVLPRGLVWHLRGLSSDGVIGLSPLELARESIGVGLAAQDYGARFFQNDARPGGYIEMPGAFKDRAARDTFRESWQQAQAGANRHRVAVLEGGMKFHEVGISNDDAQFLETRQFQVTEIARIFRVPPHMIADLSRATFSNIEHQALEFVTHTMTPWAERWESSIETSLLIEDDVEIEFDFAGLLRGDQKARAEFYQSGINAGWMTRNEARLAENLNPLDGLDEPLAPLNMATASEVDDAEDAAEENVAPEPPEAPDANARLQAVLRSQAHRMARRVAKVGAVDDREAQVIAEALAVPVERVIAWANATRTDADVETLARELESL